MIRVPDIDLHTLNAIRRSAPRLLSFSPKVSAESVIFVVEPP
eukprot:SAG31_NODE_16892_length_691_cov_1.209459_1_plen_41_part_10